MEGKMEKYYVVFVNSHGEVTYLPWPSKSDFSRDYSLWSREEKKIWILFEQGVSEERCHEIRARSPIILPPKKNFFDRVIEFLCALDD